MEFAESSNAGRYLDFERLPKLVIKGPLFFEHRGENFEDTLQPSFHVKSQLEIQAIDGGAMYREVCLEGFVNTAYWMGMQWPEPKQCLVLLNAPNTTRASDGTRVGGRFCDVWWFSHDRNTLYSVVPAASNLQTRWPPRDDDVYAACPVGIVRGAFPLVPKHVQELVPRKLLLELVSLRATAKITEKEHRLLRYICVPPTPPERSARLLFSGESLREFCNDADSDESELSESEYENIWDVAEVSEEERPCLWQWVHFLGLSKPLLMRERYREESPSLLDFTEPLQALVRLREFGLDPTEEPAKLLRQCLDVVLDCCPPRWQKEAKRGVLICPTSRKMLLTAKSCHYLLRAIPLPLRAVLGLTHSAGTDFPCKWGVNMTSGPGRLVTWRNAEQECDTSTPRRYIVKNTRFARNVRDALSLGDVRKLIWADLKMYEVLRVLQEDAGTISVATETPKTINVVAIEEKEQLQSVTVEKSKEELEAVRMDGHGAVLEIIRMANEHAKNEKGARKQGAAFVLKTQKATAPKRHGQEVEHTKATAENTLSHASRKKEDAAFLKLCSPALEAVKLKETNDDLDELQRKAETRSCPANTFRSVGRNMKRALQQEKRLEDRRRMSDLFRS